MFRIGEFARMAQVSVRLLHHYDHIGLLRPACIDRSSGYRFYALDQLQRLHRILALKDLGLSLEQITDLVTESLSAEQIRGMLLLKQSELRQSINEAQSRLARVEERLKYIEQEGALPDFDVVLKSVPTLHVLSIRRALNPGDPPAALFYAASAALRQHGLRERVDMMVGLYHLPYMRLLHPDHGQKLKMLFEAAYVMNPPQTAAVQLDSGRRLHPRELPACDVMACVIYRGSDNTRREAHLALRRWMDDECYTLTGPTREIYLHRNEQNPDDHLTEVQFPVRKIDPVFPSE
jgi:DNA-binding transcriptional MerR regulator